MVNARTYNRPLKLLRSLTRRGKPKPKGDDGERLLHAYGGHCGGRNGKVLKIDLILPGKLSGTVF